MVSINTSDSCMPLFESNTAQKVRLFCFPYAGSGASIFRDWELYLSPKIQVFAVQIPGREERFREPPLTRILELVKGLSDLLYPYLDMPFAFFGHSLGALISFELARTIRKRYSLEPELLFVSGRSAPHLLSKSSPIHLLPNAQFIAKIRSLKGTSELILNDNDFMQMLIPILRSDFEMIETYKYTDDSPFTCPIVAIGGLCDSINQCDMMAWKLQTINFFKLHMLPGDHFFIHSSRKLLLEIILRELLEILQRA